MKIDYETHIVVGFFYGSDYVWRSGFIKADLMAFKTWFSNGLEVFYAVFPVWWLYSFGVLFRTVVGFLWRWWFTLIVVARVFHVLLFEGISWISLLVLENRSSDSNGSLVHYTFIEGLQRSCFRL